MTLLETADILSFQDHNFTLARHYSSRAFWAGDIAFTSRLIKIFGRLKGSHHLVQVTLLYILTAAIQGFLELGHTHMMLRDWLGWGGWVGGGRMIAFRGLDTHLMPRNWWGWGVTWARWHLRSSNTHDRGLYNISRTVRYYKDYSGLLPGKDSKCYFCFSDGHAGHFSQSVDSTRFGSLFLHAHCFLPKDFPHTVVIFGLSLPWIINSDTPDPAPKTCVPRHLRVRGFQKFLPDDARKLCG